MFKVLVSDPLNELGLQKLMEADDARIDLKFGLTERELVDIIPEYDALLVRSQTKVTPAVIEAAERLKAIGRAGVGVDNIDITAATKKGIVVLNAPEGNTISTAEHTFAMLIALARRIPQAHRSIIEGRWDRKNYVGVELNQKILGVVGLGRIGAEVAKRAQAFHMKIIAYDPFLTEERAHKLGVAAMTLDELVRQADFITVHTPLTKETRHLIGSQAFEKMKDGVRIVNCARGGIIDEKALLETLQTGKVAGAALDVFEVEPPVDNPLIEHPNVIVTPHLGASTIEAQTNVANDVSEEILRVLRGKPIKNAVNLPSAPANMLEKLEPYFQLSEKLGYFIAQTTNGGLREIQVTYSGELAELDTSSLSRSVLKGLLAHHLGENVNYVNAPHLAREREISFTEEKSPEDRGFTNLITVTLKTDQEERIVAGTMLNGFGPRIVKLDEYRVDIQPAGHLILIRHHDRPGAIGHVGAILGNNDVNIATMQVGRRDAGGRAIMVLGVDRQVSLDALDQIGALSEIDTVTEIDLT